MAEKKPTADPKNILDLLTAPPEAQRTFDALKRSPEAQKLQSVLDEAARLERRDDLENLSHELHAEQIRKEDERLQLALEREAFDRIERDEMARLSARAKWDASQQTAQAVPAAAPPARVAPSASNTPKKARRNLLSPVIEAAQRTTGNPLDVPAVWASLVQMAEAGKRPLLGITDDGIKWQDANDEPQFFKLRNLRDRLRRSGKRTL